MAEGFARILTMGNGMEEDPQAPPGLTMTYDFGTTSLKAALIDVQGTILSHSSMTYPLVQARTGWAEQDPSLLWDVGAQAGKQALDRAGIAAAAVDSIVFVSPWKAIIPVGHDGTILRDAMIWMDGRAVEEARLLNERLGEFVGTGQEYWPRLMWLKRHQPETWNAARWIMGMTTYLKWMATGVVVTEPADDFMRSDRPALAERYERILTAAGLVEDLDKFPLSASPSALVGSLTEAAARHLELRPGISVYGGFGDLPAITLGAGPVEPGATHVYLGTSSWFVCVVEAEAALESPLRFTIDRRLDGAAFGLQCGCLAFNWICDQVYAAEKAHQGDAFFDFLDAEIAAVPPGSDNLLATHWLTGELPPFFSKNAKGVYLNLTPLHERRHMVRAMMESLCYSHRLSIEWFEAQRGNRVNEVVAVGGGACSPVWMQMFADVLGRTVLVPEAPRFVGAMGAFRCARPASSPEPNRQGRREAGRRFEPDPDRTKVYDRMVSAYRKIHPALVDLFETLNGNSAVIGDAIP